MKGYQQFIPIFFIASLLGFNPGAAAQVWQWSVTVDSVVSGETKGHPKAFLWIPENCKQVRCVVVGQHNMIEEGIFEHPVFRKEMAKLGFAIVWVSPMFNINFDFTGDAGEDFNYMMRKLADSSGYKELAYAPIVPVGHSAAATYPWNFAAFNPQKTLAVISIHGDSPQTKLTGYGKPNVDWGKRNIDGIPGLFVMGEFEWWEDRMTAGFEYVQNNPSSPITFFCDAGHGHFDYSDELINYLVLFIKKAAFYRLPARSPLNKPAQLKFVEPSGGWLIDKWRKDSLPIAKAAPYKSYKGDRMVASWVFDKEMANTTEKFYATARGKKSQFLGFVQDGQVVQPDKTHASYHLKFKPEIDGISFNVSAFYADSSKLRPAKEHTSAPIMINRICGPVKKINDTTFQLSFYRMGFNNPRRSNDIWLLASSKGDATYKSVVQQANLRFPLWNKEGKEQQIIFQAIPNQAKGIKSLKLFASSTAGVSVLYYVKEGPAEVIGRELLFTKIPPRANYPMKVTVVAWQYGRSIAPKLQSAQPVERTFYIIQ